MELVELTYRDGLPLYVNPEFVVSVSEYRGPEVEEGEGPLSSVQLADVPNAWIVRGQSCDIVDGLS
jgi:hypothetical protein